jgi:hypothetical protein
MGKLVRLLVLLLCFSFLSCNLKEKNVNLQLLQKDISKLKIEVNNLKKETQNLKIENAELEVTEIGVLKLFAPKNLTVSLYSKRPQKNSKIYLVVPAAFTDPTTKIDGLFIENGNYISSRINKKLNGVCIIFNNKVQFINSVALNENLVNDVITKKQSLFQQVLLVFNSKIVECPLFKNDLNLRRAIVEIKNHFYIVQSKTKTSILDFQNSLITIQVKNAIYLDMGTYSEGWYRENNKVISIGETMTQTNRQSNWLVFEAETQK